jgi:hypothetical protein
MVYGRYIELLTMVYTPTNIIGGDTMFLQVKFEFFVRVRPDVMYFALDQLPSKAPTTG